MRAVVVTGEGVVELAWMWLPTWIGMNGTIKKELEKALKGKIEGMPITPGTLDEMSDLVIDALVGMNPAVDGLREYLDGLKYVRIDGANET